MNEFVLYIFSYDIKKKKKYLYIAFHLKMELFLFFEKYKKLIMLKFFLLHNVNVIYKNE